MFGVVCCVWLCFNLVKIISGWPLLDTSYLLLLTKFFGKEASFLFLAVYMIKGLHFFLNIFHLFKCCSQMGLLSS